LEAIRRIASGWLADKYRAKGRIIAEQQLEFEGEEIVDYKFYVCNGKVSLIMCGVMNKKGGTRTYSFYDLHWKRYDINVHPSVAVSKPELFDDMIVLSEKIGANFPFIRVDMYSSEGKIYIGELTGLPFNGLFPYGTQNDKRFGAMLQLPSKQDIELEFKDVFKRFPELVASPIFLKDSNPNYRIIQPNNSSDNLPLPPESFMQPMKM